MDPTGRWIERIDADLLIPGNAEPIHEGVVVRDGPTITYAGPAGDAPPTPQAPSTREATVLPGLWDCHAHLLGTRSLDLGRLPLEPLALRAARCASDLRAALDAGVTSVREVGGLGVYLARAVEEGTLDGPTIYGAGAILSSTGGNGDLHSLPLAWVAEFGPGERIFSSCPCSPPSSPSQRSSAVGRARLSASGEGILAVVRGVTGCSGPSIRRPSAHPPPFTPRAPPR